VAANLLHDLKYSCQANQKTREGGNHPDRDAQFAPINRTVNAAIAAGEPAISVELVDDYKPDSARQRWRPTTRGQRPGGAEVSCMC
jgi:hypothetical protein